MGNDILSRFWNYYIEKTKGYDMSDYSARQYVRLVNAYIKHYPKLRLKQHTEAEVENYLQQVALNNQQESVEFSQVVEALKIFFQDVVRFPWAASFPWSYWCDLAGTLQQASQSPLAASDLLRAPKPEIQSELLNHAEIQQLFSVMDEPLFVLMARLIYGCGLRLKEVIRLRVFDIDFSQAQILVRNEDGSHDRIIPIPEKLLSPLREHIINTEIMFAEDLASGFGGVYLPAELQQKHPNASRELRWQYLFAASLQTSSRTGKACRHHLDESTLEESIRQTAIQAGIKKKINARSLRNSFAAHLIDSGHDVYAVGKLLGEENISNLMIVAPKPVQDYFTIETNFL